MTKHKMTEYKYIHKIELTGNLELITPLHIGSGNSSNSDSDILSDANENPYIPGSSIAGVLRHYFKSMGEKSFAPTNEKSGEKSFAPTNDLDDLFGSANDENNNSKQSGLIFYDSSLISNKKTVKIRDGIRIDNTTGIAEDRAKFDYEVLEPGVDFDFKIALRYSNDEKEKAKQILKTIEVLLSCGHIKFGANTNNGLGKIKLVQPVYRIYEIDSPESVWNKILQKPVIKKAEELDVKPLEINVDEFSIRLMASVCNSLIIGDSDPDFKSDKTHIKSNCKPVITGSSLKGAIRAGITRILNTISPKDKKENYYKLKYAILGYTKEEFNNNNSFEERFENINKYFKYKNIQGKLKVNESVLKNTHPELQPRVRIDRFTHESALFDSMPQFASNDSTVEIEFKLNKKGFAWEAGAGLLLLVLKDLWTGMLPIGGEKNIGRGRLDGNQAIIAWEKDHIENPIVIEKGKMENLQELNFFVEKLKKYLQEEVI